MRRRPLLACCFFARELGTLLFLPCPSFPPPLVITFHMNRAAPSNEATSTQPINYLRSLSPRRQSSNEQVRPAQRESEASMCKSPEDKAPAAPWWRRGGMHVCEVGMGVTVMTPPFLLYQCTDDSPLQSAFLILLVFSIFSAITIHGMRTAFCTIAVPTYMASLIFSLTLPNPVIALTMALLLAIIKVGICMSVCLHRYAAHAAFKCSDTTRFWIMVLGCSANQGGPIWWASQHRCHHKHCDIPGDPHSQQVDGVEKAFAFFGEHNTVNEEFAPKHCGTTTLRILDTFSFVVLWVELYLAYIFAGPTGLFIQYTGSWLCQTMTLWFNIANHPVSDIPGTCTAQDDKGPLMVYYPAFCLLNTLYPVFGLYVAERNHKHHHDHSQLAKRSDVDGAYFTFILPLQQMGIIWDVKVPNTKKTS